MCFFFCNGIGLEVHTVAVAQLTRGLLLSSVDPGHRLCVPSYEAVIPRLQIERDQVVVNKKSYEFKNLCPKCISKKVFYCCLLHHCLMPTTLLHVTKESFY